MSDLNLNFDTGTKSISLEGSSGSGNLGFVPDTGSGANSPIKTIDLSPNLTVSDPAGFEMLTKGKNPDPVPPSSNPTMGSGLPPKEEFSFFSELLWIFHDSISVNRDTSGWLTVFAESFLETRI